MKLIALEHLRGGRGQEAFYSTEISAEALAILTWFSWRWPVEIAFHDCQQHFQVSEAQSRTSLAVERTAPNGLLLYSLLVLWHEFVRPESAKVLRGWRGKRCRLAGRDACGLAPGFPGANAGNAFPHP